MFAVILSIIFLFVLVGLLGLLFGRFDVFDRHPRDGGFRWFAAWWLGFIAVSWAGRIVARRYARRIIGPLKDMGAAARTLASGNYTVRVPKPYESELADLAGDFNALAEELESTEQRRLRLIGDVAHELRTPLQTIEGSMEALMDRVIEPSDEVFAAIAEEAARLKRLVFDLSSLSKSEEGSYRLDRRLLDLRSEASDVLDLLEHQFDAKEVSLALSPGVRVPVQADPDRLAQILTNVIGNALAYTDAGGTVTVGVVATDGRARAIVSDTGRGIDADDLAQIFDRFCRVDDRTSTGTGVGLTIARTLARSHGGDVAAESGGEGHGSRFTIDLPLADE
jgi:signal transduction histidine kinase